LQAVFLLLCRFTDLGQMSDFGKVIDLKEYTKYFSGVIAL